MSVLAPLYLLGLLAISLPLVFHLIRRSPRGEQQFSSLMFLDPSPPRLTRRSRLDNLLLLLLRALAISLLALAFARPFLRQAALATVDDVSQERVAVLVDTSGSMQRGDLWSQATDAVNQAVGRYRPQDQFAVFAFDETLRPVASYEDLAALAPEQRHAAVEAALGQHRPTWSATHLGQAMADALLALEDVAEADADQVAARRRVVLVSDMQQGSRLHALSEVDWPDNTQLELIALRPSQSTNAGVELLGQRPSAEQMAEHGSSTHRVRVHNAGNSTRDVFQLQWFDDADQPLAAATEVFAPAGESRVVRIEPPADPAAGRRLVLTGDDHPFDNTLHIVPPEQQDVVVGYLGTDAADDPSGMRYYLSQALAADTVQQPRLEARSPGDEAIVAEETEPRLVVVTAPPSESQASELRTYAAEGGTVLYVVTSEADGPPLGTLAGTEAVEITPVEADDYVMLGEIDFDHRLFAPMSQPQFNDFTQIRFWNYRRIDASAFDEAHVVARFENDAPAVIEQRVGTGRLVVLASAWHPEDSQLARSWKFLLMISTLLADPQDAQFQWRTLVDQPVNLPDGLQLAAGATLTRPDGAQVPIDPDATRLTDTELPGIYTLDGAAGPVQFAVHVDPQESHTAPLAQERFEQLGCQLTAAFDAEAAREQLQQMRDVELESRQKVWKWLIAAALGVLIAETLLAGWLARRADAPYAAGPTNRPLASGMAQ